MQRDDVQPVANETLDRFLTGTITVLPIVSLGVVGWQLWEQALHTSDLIVFAIVYPLTGLGITVGFHRHLTHRSFKAKRPVRAALAILGSAAVEGPVISWVADHRKHHAFSDEPGDPHSPHVDHGGGLRGTLKGLAHAHLGWLFVHDQRALKTRYAPDLLKDPMIRFVDRTFVVWVLAGLAVPFGLGWAIGGSFHAALTGPPVGRPRADVPAPPRHLLDQLALPLLRPARLRHRRSLAQSRVARAAVVRRVVAQQPPRLPDIRAPRPQAVAGRRRRRGGLGAREDRAGVGCCAREPARWRKRARRPPPRRSSRGGGRTCRARTSTRAICERLATNALSSGGSRAGSTWW